MNLRLLNKGQAWVRNTGYSINNGIIKHLTSDCNFFQSIVFFRTMPKLKSNGGILIKQLTEE